MARPTTCQVTIDARTFDTSDARLTYSLDQRLALTVHKLDENR